MSRANCEGTTGSVESWSAAHGGMRARGPVAGFSANQGMSALHAKYSSVRSMTDSLMAGLSTEDQTVQSCADASPLKWHRAHTTWFFETFVLRPFLADYKPFREEFHWLFNSYYISLGEEIPEKKLRSSFSRPSLGEVVAFRKHVDREMERLFAHSIDIEVCRRIVLGLNHEQQHQELALTDLKHAFFSNPLRPSYRSCALPKDRTREVATLEWHDHEGGVTEIGYSPNAGNPLDFSFDNETPRHRVYLEPFQIANRSVTCREYLEFMSDDGYTRPGLWLSDGWELVKQSRWEAPLYWERDADDETGWQVFTLRGRHGLSDLLDTAVCHISFYEADAFAKWRDCRLPTEAEWESIASEEPLEVTSCSGEWDRERRATLWRLLGMDSECLHRLSQIQISSGISGRIQRQVHVRSDDPPRRVVRHSGGSYSRNLPQFLFPRNALAVLRSTFGKVRRRS